LQPQRGRRHGFFPVGIGGRDPGIPGYLRADQDGFPDQVLHPLQAAEQIAPVQSGDRHQERIGGIHGQTQVQRTVEQGLAGFLRIGVVNEAAEQNDAAVGMCLANRSLHLGEHRRDQVGPVGAPFLWEVLQDERGSEISRVRKLAAPSAFPEAVRAEALGGRDPDGA